jgi:hypothetical protein
MTCPPLQILYGVSCKIVREVLKDQDHQYRPAIDMHGDLKRGVTFEEVFHNKSAG